MPGRHRRNPHSACPALAGVARLERASTSAGISRADTGEQFVGSGGLHTYIVIADGADAERFLTALHQHLWLASFGWFIVSKSGALLARSPVDRSVAAGERLVFEAPPVLHAPLTQDQKVRKPLVFDGAEVIDARVACPSLSSAEEAQLRELCAKAAAALKPERSRARTTFIDRQAPKLAERTGIDPARACQVIKRQCDGVLLPGVELAFDDAELAGATVGDVLANPDRFVGETLGRPPGRT
jgi:hypothetical protein